QSSTSYRIFNFTNVRFNLTGSFTGHIKANDLHFSRLVKKLKQTTYIRLEIVWKSSGLLGSLLTKSSRLPGSRLDFLKVIWTSCKVV
ncbi:unnamed protein product, partial [Brassica rapa subsp. trilocularis]